MNTLYLIYIVAVLVFVWMTTIYLFVGDLTKRKTYKRFDVAFTVVIPVFNEPIEILERTIKSSIDADGCKDVIVVNDGSKIDYTNLCKKYKVTYIDNKVNRGKKWAQTDGILASKYEYVISTDSDTIFMKDAFTKLINPLQDKSIGLTTGNIEFQEGKGLLYDLQVFQFKMCFAMGRRAMGIYGLCNCGSGALIGFRKSEFIELKDKYLVKNVLKMTIRFGEDRYMTNLLLERGLKSLYVEDSLGLTVAVDNWKQYFKQQLRWTISGIVQGLYAIKFMWRTQPMLWLYNVLYLSLPFVSLALLSHSIIFYPQDLLWVLMGSIASGIIKEIYVLLRYKGLWKQAFIFSLINFFVIQWLWIVAIFKIRANTWLTR